MIVWPLQVPAQLHHFYSLCKGRLGSGVAPVTSSDPATNGAPAKVAPRWHLSREKISRTAGGEDRKANRDYAGVFQEAIKTFISLRNLGFSDKVHSLQHIFWDGFWDLFFSDWQVFRTNAAAVLRGIIKRLFDCAFKGVFQFSSLFWS